MHAQTVAPRRQSFYVVASVLPRNRDEYFPGELFSCFTYFEPPMASTDTRLNRYE